MKNLLSELINYGTASSLFTLTVLTLFLFSYFSAYGEIITVPCFSAA